MQRSSGQYDDLARVPRTGPRQSRGRRSFAPRHWCRATPRRSRGMEPAVRNPRIEPAIGSGRCSKLAFQQTIPKRLLVSSVPKFSRRERNFWMQRPEAKNPPERPLLSAETGKVENRRQDPRKNGPFSIDDDFRSSGRLGGGDDLDQTGCPPRRDRTKSPKLESGTEFFAAETGRRNGLIRLDCRNRDRANQSIWQTCL